MAGMMNFDAFIYLLRDPTADQGVQKPTPQTPHQADQGTKSPSKPNQTQKVENLLKQVNCSVKIHHPGHRRCK